MEKREPAGSSMRFRLTRVFLVRMVAGGLRVMLVKTLGAVFPFELMPLAGDETENNEK